MDPRSNNSANGEPRPRPTSAPSVPKGLLSARPAMTRVVPRSPDKMPPTTQPAVSPAPQPTAEELAEREERLEYLRNLRSQERNAHKGGGKKWLVAFVVLLILVAIAAAGYWYLSRSSSTAPAATTTTPTTAQSKQQPTTPAGAQPAQDMKDYQSTNFTVSFKYPGDWKVSDTTTSVSVTSPQESFTAANGQKVSGQVVMTIRHKQTTLPEFKTGNAVAVLDSKKLTYSQPAAGQRGQTFISYLQYDSTTTKGALDAIYVTGNSGYQKGQYIPQGDIVKVDPLITVSFIQCTTAAATCAAATAPPISVQASSWVTSDLNATIEAMLKSLAIS